MSFKFSVRFAQYGTGLAESWYVLATDPSTICKAVTSYTRIRQMMLPTTAIISDVRVGQSQLTMSPSDGKDHLRVSNLYLPGVSPFWTPNQSITVAGPNGAYDEVTVDETPAQSNISIQLRVILATGRKSTRYLVWPPHATLRSDPKGVLLSAAPAFNKGLTLLQNFIAGGGGAEYPGGPLYVKALVPPDVGNNFQILSWQIQNAAPSNIGFAITNAQAAGYTIGQTVHITNTRRRPAPSQGACAKLISLNGYWNIQSTVADSPEAGVTTVYLANSAGIDVSSLKINGYAQLRQYALVQAVNVYAVRCRTHKRGKDWSQPAGRRLSRATAGV